MIRAGAVALLLASPAGAEGLCAAAWEKVSAGLTAFGTVSGTVGQDGDWCVVQGAILDLDGQYLPDWHLDRLRFRGAALGWLVDGSTLPEGLEVAVDGLRLVVQTGNPQMDWLFAAQSRPNAINADAALSWDSKARVLRLEGLSIDFPGENLIEVSALVRGVDLASTGAMQMSLTSFALTEADLAVTTHGLFEGFALAALAPMLLPVDGDMDAAAEAIRADLLAGVGDLPGDSFTPDSKAALRELVAELPNPSGTLTLGLRAEAGLGPARLGGYAMTGAPGTVAEAAPLLQGLTVDVGWTHTDAP